MAADKLNGILKPNIKTPSKASTTKKHKASGLKSQVGTTSRFRGCFHCGKTGNRWHRCFKRKKKIQLLWSLKKCWVWVTKKNLYGKMSGELEHFNYKNAYSSFNKAGRMSYSASGVKDHQPVVNMASIVTYL
ncbi:unnamed protein product [Arabis nemorensis]|uniref:Uncharacterized protein n=1 Tax=Arabis nemorensis TaxID=586526 RepID=A0A565CP28_9BRAS|nr:unnamed protein product [Arabis nemorensis]